jgi:hypothetical protein
LTIVRATPTPAATRRAAALALFGALGACSGSDTAPVGISDASDEPTADALDPDASTDDAPSPDAPASDASRPDAPGPVADGDTPPPECVPACLWNLFKDCRVTAPCFDQPVDGGTLSCRPSTGITWFTGPSGARTVYRADHSVCYTTTGGDPNTWRDGTGVITIVVKQVSPTSLEASCDGSSFEFHPNTPECKTALGSAESCMPGSCTP